MRLTEAYQDWLSQIDHNCQVYESNDTVFEEGDLFEGVYYILEGCIKMSRKGNNAERIVWFAKSDELIGLTCYYQNSGKYSFTAVAYDALCKIVHIPGNKFSQLMNESVEFKKKVINVLCTRINFAENRITDFMRHDTKERFINTMVQLIDKKNSDRNPNGLNEINVDCTLAEISVLVGTSEEYLKKIIYQFHKLGIVTLKNKKLVVTDVGKLKKMNNKLNVSI